MAEHNNQNIIVIGNAVNICPWQLGHVVKYGLEMTYGHP